MKPLLIFPFVSHACKVIQMVKNKGVYLVQIHLHLSQRHMEELFKLSVSNSQTLSIWSKQRILLSIQFVLSSLQLFNRWEMLTQILKLTFGFKKILTAYRGLQWGKWSTTECYLARNVATDKRCPALSHFWLKITLCPHSMILWKD